MARFRAAALARRPGRPGGDMAVHRELSRVGAGGTDAAAGTATSGIDP
ncbi:hypothetical protein [Nocardioides sediminis]|nr:hypothetical protein [Nocardioides sediminis]